MGGLFRVIRGFFAPVFDLYYGMSYIYRRQSPILLLLMGISTLSLGQGVAIKDAIPVPNGYQRQNYTSGSYSHWIQNLPLKAQPVILDYRGQAVESRLYSVYGVVRMPLLFRSDLEQCADFAMRFWAEYHRATGKLDQL